MDCSLFWDEKATQRFPSLLVCLGIIGNVNVTRSNEKIKALRNSVTEGVKRKYNIEVLKDNLTVRAYRDLFWRLDIDPTKTRPSGEALLRRVLHGEEIPVICSVVDAYNLASLMTIIPLSGFDLDKIALPLHVRFSKPSEEFQGIGMQTPMRLDAKMLLLTDKNQILCIYPHRDADATKITVNTKNVLIVGYGAPNISKSQLSKAVETALSYIKRVAGGSVEQAKVYAATS